jgi:hypothetical protein
MQPPQFNFPRLNGAGIITWAAPPLLVAFYAILATLPNLGLAVPELTGLTGLLVILLAVILYRGERHPPNWPLWLILTIAMAIRVPFLMRPPELSDDIYRYLWDGLQLLSGQNPYALPPKDIPVVTGILQTIKAAVNHPELVTIYGPAAQLFFGLASFFGGTVAGVKVALVLVDLGCCHLLCCLLRRLQIPPWKSVLYAWHPLPVLEIAGSGHIDGVGLFLLLAALLAVTRNDNSTDRAIFPYAAGLLTACSVLVKLFPAVFLPGFLLLQTQRRWPFIAAFILGSIALTFPFLPELTNGLQTLHTYTANWEFSSFSFRSLRYLLDSSLAARMVIGAVFFLAASRLYLLFHRSLKTCSGQNKTLAMLETFYALALFYLLLTPTLHPWYGLYLIWLLPFAAEACGLILSWSLLLGYQVLIAYFLLGQWQENDLAAFLTWLGPVAALAVKLIYNKKRVSFPLRKKDTLPKE